MAWAPTAPAAWVDQANRGELPEYLPAPGVFDAEALMAAAAARHPDGSFGDDLTEPLAVFCAALEAEADLTPLGRWATQRYLARLLDGHRAIRSLRLVDPDLATEQILRPVFVIGAPRTGTTVMHRFLAADPAHRVPEGWEFAMPVPPPEPATHDTDPRIEAMAPELVFPQSVAGDLATIHTYSSRMPKECLSAMAFACRTEEFISRYHVPRYARWLAAADMTPAYAMHRLVLQVLQRRMPARRWILKSPVHLQNVESLVATYPDASFVITHRDPGAVLGSVSSLIATLRSAFSAMVDPVEIGRYHLALYGSSLDALVDHVDRGMLPPERTVHVRHTDLVADPVAAIEATYATVGGPMPDGVRAAIAAEAVGERADAPGGHRYALADFGLADDEVDRRFARYRSRFLEDR